MELKVKGHSGCAIDIVNEGNNLRIHKWSKDPKYLSRLANQAIKQQEAAKEEYQHIRIPQIYNIEKDDQHVLIDMEYVYSRNFIEFFEGAGFEQIDYFIKALILFLEKELKVSPVQSVPTSITLEKFYDVEKKVNCNPILANDTEIQRLMNLSRQKFEIFSKQKNVNLPIGICHGDLTFSNILFNGNNYYLIDFLDSFIESPLLDIVKIRQDSAHLWSQLMYTKTYDGLRLKIIYNKIDKDINKYFQKYDWYNNFYDVYQLLNLLRVLQYAKEKKVISFLKKELANVMNVASRIQQQEDNTSNDIVESKKFSLIVPAAADNVEHPDSMPYVFSLDSSGIMLCLRSIQGLNLNIFDDIYITILHEHAEKFCLVELFKLQIKRLGLNNVHLVVLDGPTTSQSETVYKTIIKESINGSVFIKDADGFFTTEIVKENGVAVFPLEAMEMINPQHKSYVSIDDMYYITNIIENRVISHFFNVGGVCFEKSTDFLYYYLRLYKEQLHLCMSHIIYAMLLDKIKFRPIEAKKYIDWGDEKMFNYNKQGYLENV